jgi:hypothetical protein
MAILVCLFTCVVFALERLLPFAHEVLTGASDGGAALLLAVPAVALALLARPGENQVAATLLAPLRAIILICSMFLMAGAASLVGELWHPYVDALWWAGTLVSGGMLGALLVGQLESAYRQGKLVTRLYGRPRAVFRMVAVPILSTVSALWHTVGKKLRRTP